MLLDYLGPIDNHPIPSIHWRLINDYKWQPMNTYWLTMTIRAGLQECFTGQGAIPSLPTSMKSSGRNPESYPYCFISTERALRLPRTYDNHPIPSIRPSVHPLKIDQWLQMITFWPHSGHILTAFWLHPDYILTLLWLHFCLILTAFSLHSDLIMTLLWLHSDYFLTSFCLHRDYIVTIFFATFLLHFGYILAIF